MSQALGCCEVTILVTDDGVPSQAAMETFRIVRTPHCWQNPKQAGDVDDDGTLDPLDVLLLFFDIDRYGARDLTATLASSSTPPPYLDQMRGRRRSVRLQPAFGVFATACAAV